MAVIDSTTGCDGYHSRKSLKVKYLGDSWNNARARKSVNPIKAIVFSNGSISSRQKRGGAKVSPTARSSIHGQPAEVLCR